MRTLQTSARNHTTFRQTRLVCALLITLALLVSLQNPFTVSARSAPVESTISLDTAGAPALAGTVQVIEDQPGNEFNAHVDCDVASYTYDDFQGSSTIHYQNLSTGVDSVIPGNQVDLLSDVSGSHVAFTEVTFNGDTVRVFDTSSQTQIVVPGLGLSNPSIGGNLVAFEDRGSVTSPGAVDISTYDLSSQTVTKLTNDSFDNESPDVSPNGDAVVWAQCISGQAGCDIYSAIQTSPGVFTTRQLTSGRHEGRYEVSTNGEVAVYISDRTGERDVYYQPLTGGNEVHLAIAGDQWSPTISGDLISFQSGPLGVAPMYVYDIRSGNLFQVVVPTAYNRIPEINVCGDTGRIVYSSIGPGNFAADAFTFQVPSVTEDQIHNLISLIRSFNLPSGTTNSLITKLQSALTAIDFNDTATACSSLTAFINECRAQSGKKLTPDQSTQLINSANHIKTDLGCP
ncbi:MAG: hypothetical protein C5B55_14210 [Blastocatellia bacterium]|nr:MAG: hypothetical protein C5B55_14210 [Blastocatellia bacterium]